MRASVAGRFWTKRTTRNCFRTCPDCCVTVAGECITMVEQAQNYRSYDPDIDGYDQEPGDHRVTRYRFGHSARADSHPDKSVPLFLSDYDGEPDPSEYF